MIWLNGSNEFMSKNKKHSKVIDFVSTMIYETIDKDKINVNIKSFAGVSNECIKNKKNSVKAA